MIEGLGPDAVIGGHHQNRRIHALEAANGILEKPGMAGNIDENGRPVAAATDGNDPELLG